MLRGYRLLVIALGLALAAHHPNAEAQPKQPDTQERSTRALEGIASRYDEQTRRSESSHETEQCQQGDDKRNSDLCAQWKAADAAADSAWWAAVGGFAGAISTLLVLIALWFAFRSNWIARDTAKRQLRAYCGVLSFEGQGIGLNDEPHFVLTIVNTGQTPAKRLKIDTTCWLAPMDQIAYSIDVAQYAEVTVGSGKTINSRTTLGYKLTQQHIDNLTAGTVVIYVGVYGEYVDIFDEPQSFYSVSYGARFNGQFTLKPYPGQDRCT